MLNFRRAMLISCREDLSESDTVGEPAESVSSRAAENVVVDAQGKS